MCCHPQKIWAGIIWQAKAREMVSDDSPRPLPNCIRKKLMVAKQNSPCLSVISNVKSRKELFVIAHTLLKPTPFLHPCLPETGSIFRLHWEHFYCLLHTGQVMNQTAEAQNYRALPSRVSQIVSFLSSHSNKSARKVARITEAWNDIARCGT
jgi:hypothetical protein